jgi:hypothetical protein
MIATDTLATLFVEVADTLVVDFDNVDFLHMVTTRTAEIAHADAAGLVQADAHDRLQSWPPRRSRPRCWTCSASSQRGPVPGLRPVRGGGDPQRPVPARPDGGPVTGRKPSRPVTTRYKPSRCDSATPSSVPSTCSAPPPDGSSRPTSRASKPSPTSPRSACCGAER